VGQRAGSRKAACPFPAAEKAERRLFGALVRSRDGCTANQQIESNIASLLFIRTITILCRRIFREFSVTPVCLGDVKTALDSV